MRLKHIKLVGFKSFVDPTKVPFPHQMTCVVGPNGCGKSNVIDAVRWVLGESSAKNLRGDAMTDVIFNGSNSRKPVSQASVELVFDNSSGRIQGEYANYVEISVKRLVTRDGRSDYFLNNSKCRRRDITDLFLGTGLGPRSYAIIEQGMISRLIESKPQELRIFIEEAAGISKYKERRRETENRMQHTRDNLERLQDVRDELGSQLEKLQRQAAAAKRYKELKQQERKYKAELQALRWLAQEQQADQLRLTMQQQETELERWIAEQRGSERGTTALREQAEQAKQQLDQVQHHYYQLGNDVTRVEHELQATRQQQQHRQQRYEQLRAQLQELRQTLAEDEQQQEELVVLQQQLTPELEMAVQRVAVANEDFAVAEANWLGWQDDYQTHLDAMQRHREQQQQLQLRLQQLDHQSQRLADELERGQRELNELKQQQQELNTADLEQSAAELKATNAEQQRLLSELEQQLSEQQRLREALQEQREQLVSARQQLLGRKSSLEHLLAAAQAQDWPQQIEAWLQQNKIPSLGQVRDLLAVDAAWQYATEQVVSEWLDAWVITQPPSEWPQQLGTKLVLLNAMPVAVPLDSLAAKQQGPLQQWPLLQQIHCAEAASFIEQDFAQMNSRVLSTGQVWSSFGYQAPQFDEADSQLAQQQELLDVEQQMQHNQVEQQALAEQLQQSKERLQSLQLERDRRKDELAETQLQVRQTTEKLAWHQQQLQAVTEKQVMLNQSIEEWQAQQQEFELSKIELDEQYQQLLEEPPGPIDHDWQQSRQQLQQAQQQARERLQAQQNQHQQLELQQQEIDAQLRHQQKLLARAQQQQQQIIDQLREVEQPDHEHSEQLELLAMQLEELLLQREQVDEERRQCANKVSELEAEIREISQGSKGVDIQIEKARAKLQSSQLELAALQERSRNVLAVLQEMQQPLKPILETLSDEAEEGAWQAELERLQNAIARLGAINLAAIDEAETLAERKQHLDQQHQDLTDSLEILETAIRKIDKETRQRFRATYDAINQGLQELFPKVFGGGSAYLELTDDDLLETGVAIMARPPGKKNSTIHLLSGGEKALTALSLVFAIFRLNPAPFCLLDEVDAPLDDANVGRFCRLVEEMSETVQFIYISHNKIAMEMASHLAGVTMQEAGVSRLVAVDIDEAVALTEAS